MESENNGILYDELYKIPNGYRVTRVIVTICAYKKLINRKRYIFKVEAGKTFTPEGIEKIIESCCAKFPYPITEFNLVQIKSFSEHERRFNLVPPPDLDERMSKYYESQRQISEPNKEIQLDKSQS